jgi:hypothetical protein
MSFVDAIFDFIDAHKALVCATATIAGTITAVGITAKVAVSTYKDKKDTEQTINDIKEANAARDDDDPNKMPADVLERKIKKTKKDGMIRRGLRWIPVSIAVAGVITASVTFYLYCSGLSDEVGKLTAANATLTSFATACSTTNDKLKSLLEDAVGKEKANELIRGMKEDTKEVQVTNNKGKKKVVTEQDRYYCMDDNLDGTVFYFASTNADGSRNKNWIESNMEHNINFLMECVGFVNRDIRLGRYDIVFVNDLIRKCGVTSTFSGQRDGWIPASHPLDGEDQVRVSYKVVEVRKPGTINEKMVALQVITNAIRNIDTLLPDC